MFQIKYFFDEDWMMARLSEYQFDFPKPDQFIDYQRNAREYDDERKSFVFDLNGEKIQFPIPFVEVINYYKLSGAVRIDVEGPIEPYEMPESLKKLTDENIESFVKAKPQTTDGPVLRIARLTKNSDHRYTCKLEVACYRHQVRTNLSVDYKLKSDRTQTLRFLDFANEGKNDLPDFHESNLINSIGVSSIVYYHHKKNGKLYYFLLPRKGNLGVYGNMLAAVGGVVEPPNFNPNIGLCKMGKIQENNLSDTTRELDTDAVRKKIQSGEHLCDPIEELTSHAIDEIKREIVYELGLKPEHLQDSEFKITPLAFVRELVRGGKPEFFFSVQIPYIPDFEFSKLIEHSLEGKMEFVTDYWATLGSKQPYISPQMMSIFAFELDRRQKNARIKV